MCAGQEAISLWLHVVVIIIIIILLALYLLVASTDFIEFNASQRIQIALRAV